ncbi:MAG: sigma-70 family RNA polymerase sigma factor [Bryobacteraceae bacterium]|nr:sigma-70 family RNA polymerase sigma factor [Bryobacteraceae bacterium]
MQKNRSEYSLLTDDELVTQAKSGNDAAFTELIERHRSISFKLAFSILRDRSDAEDEVQNATWKAYSHLDQFNYEAKFSTWLTRIVVNQCLMRLRKDKRAKFLYIDDVQIGDEVGTLDLRDKADTPEVDLGRREVSEILHHEVNRMPPLLKKVFWMRDIEERSMPDVAESLGISVAAAKSRLLRARHELKTRLEKHQGRLGAATLVG